MAKDASSTDYPGITEAGAGQIKALLGKLSTAERSAHA
jgi:hypothetical protein